MKITYKFDFLAENLSKKQILDVKILKPDLKMQKLDLKHQKLDLPGFLGSGGDWNSAQNKSLQSNHYVYTQYDFYWTTPTPELQMRVVSLLIHTPC